jgi:hypothetical protein
MMEQRANGVLEFRFPCGRKFGDLRGDEAKILGAEMVRLSKIIADADDIMLKYEGKTPATAQERRVVAKANAIVMTGDPALARSFEKLLDSK